MEGSLWKFITLARTPARFVIYLKAATAIHKMGHCFVEAGTIRLRDPAGDGIRTRGPGTWTLSHLHIGEMLTYPGHRQMDL